MKLVVEIQNGCILLGSVFYENHIISHPTCALYDNSDYLDILRNLISEIKTLTNIDIWYWNNYHEIIEMSYFKKIGVLDLLIDELGDSVIVVDNNLGPKNHPFYKKIRTESAPYFLGMTYPTQLKINADKEITKKFLCMNLHEKPHRTEMYKLFDSNNLFDDSFFSYMHYDPTFEFHKRLPSEVDFELEIPRSELPCFQPQYKPINEHENSFCSVVTETLFYENTCRDLLEDAMFITEKTEKCFSAGHPFVMLGRPNFLKKLKELGFKTFDKWWDESYDSIEDDDTRMESIKNTILSISKMSYDEIRDMYLEMLPTLHHNQNLNEKFYYLNRKRCNIQFFDNECTIEPLYVEL